MLEENYKSASLTEKKELIEKIALSEVKSNELVSQLNLKDDEIATLKKEIDELRERVKAAYVEKDQQEEESEKKIATILEGKDDEKKEGEEYWNEELRKAQANADHLAETVKMLEGELDKKQAELIENDNNWKSRQIEMEARIHKLESEGHVSQEGVFKDFEAQKAEYERILQEKEAQRQKQKNEWAEVSL
jgi:hypothetical protein